MFSVQRTSSLTPPVSQSTVQFSKPPDFPTEAKFLHNKKVNMISNTQHSILKKRHMKYQVILFPYGDQIHTQHKYHAILLRRQRYLNKVEINLNVLEIIESQHCHSAQCAFWVVCFPSNRTSRDVS